MPSRPVVAKSLGLILWQSRPGRFSSEVSCKGHPYAGGDQRGVSFWADGASRGSLRSRVVDGAPCDIPSIDPRSSAFIRGGLQFRIAISPLRRSSGHGIRDGHFDGFRIGLPAHSPMDLGADGLDVAANAGGEVAPEAMIEPGDLDQPRRLSVSAAVNGRTPQVVRVELGSQLPPQRCFGVALFRRPEGGETGKPRATPWRS